MATPPAPPDSSHPPLRTPRGLSIRWKLFLFIGGLVTVVTVGFGAAAYRAMRGSALSATSMRLDGIAAQWARMFESGTTRQFAAFRAVARLPAVRDALSRRDQGSIVAAEAGLRRLLPAGQRSVVQLLDQGRVTVLTVGDPAASGFGPVDPGFLDTAAALDSVLAGPLRAAGDAIVGSYAMPIVVDGVVAGYITQSTQLRVTPSPDELNRLFGGTATQVRLANRDGSVWSDLAKPLPGPGTPVLVSDQLQSYISPRSGPVFAAVRPIRGTPWMVVLETSEDEVLAQSRRLLRGLLIAGAIAIGLGVIVAIVLSDSLSRPVARLTEFAEAVASGDYSRRAGLGPRRDELGRLAGAFDAMVTRVRESFDAQRDAEAYYRGLFESVPLPVWLYDRETLAILAVNDAAIRHYGYPREEFLSMTVAELRPAEDVPRLREAIRESGPVYQRGEWRHRKKDGTVIEVEVHARSMMFHGRASRLVVVHDVTERKEVLDRVRRSDERYRRLIEESSDGITLTAMDGGFLAVNPAFVRMLGYQSEAEVFEIDPEELYANPETLAPIRAKLEASGQIRREEVQLRRQDGKVITVQVTARLVTEPGSNERYLESVVEDVTELRRIEYQFHQAQKMEAVGQLAGGIAHDFNNLLTVILSYSDMLLTDLRPDAAEREAIQSIHGAGISAAALTRQLLIFSRREVVQPQVMRLNEMIAGTGKMLKRLLGERVELATVLAPDAGAVKVDPGQLEQVIVNLAVNSRDAMPGGGRLLIESRNVDIPESSAETSRLLPPGAYVLLAVSDNGSGMDAATQARIFEPFFTTKEQGKGTGLGLATVYGIVKQSGGHIAVYSEPDSGTSFKIYLPRVDDSLGAIPGPADGSEGQHGTETILIVEDEITLQGLVGRILERKGYRVLSATDGDAALHLVANYPDQIHLVLTDVVMPRMSGRELADALDRLRPGMRVLFMSGYTDDAIVHHGVLEAGMHFIEKPFTVNALAKKVRQVLDASGGPTHTG